MVQPLTVFNVITVNEELENNFHSFFYENNLLALFTHEHRAAPIKVTDLDARSVVNFTGKYHKTLKKFADYITMANDNKMYEEALFKILYTSTSFQSLMNHIKKIIEVIESDIDIRHLFNTWNIVWYNKTIY